MFSTMDRYEKRAAERDTIIANAYKKSNEPPTYWDHEEVKEYIAVTELLRKASATYTPPGGDSDGAT